MLLAACAAQRSVLLPPMEDWAGRRQALESARDWEFSGRIAVSAGDDGFNGKIRWQQHGDGFQITVGGPLGIGTVRIEGDGQRIVHTDKDGVVTEMQDAEQDLLMRYGWTIPVRSLRFWALGIPDPAVAAETQLDSEQRLARLGQGGWTVQIVRYRDGGGQSMPGLLSANNAATRVRIVFDKWLFFD